MKLKILLTTLLLSFAYPTAAFDPSQDNLIFSEAILLAGLAADYISIGKLEPATRLLDEVSSVSQTVGGLCPRLRLLTDMAGQYALVGQLARSEALFSQVQKALAVRQPCEDEPSSSSRNDPPVWVLGAIGFHAFAGRYDVALAIADGLTGEKGFNPQDSVYAKNSATDVLFELLSRFEQMKLHDRATELRNYLASLANRYNQTGQINKAGKIWYFLANEYKRIGQPERASEFQNLAAQTGQEPKSTPLPALGSPIATTQILSHCLQVETPRSLWEIQEVLSKEKLAFLVETCNKNATAETREVSTLRASILKQMDEFVQEIAEPIKQGNALVAVANVYSQTGEKDKAIERLGKAVSTLKSISERLRQVGPQNPIDLDRHSLVPEDLPKAQASQVLSLAVDAELLTAKIVEGYLQIGQIEQAVEIGEQVRTGKIYLFKNFDYAYSEIAPRIVQFYAEAGQFERAFQLVETLGMGKDDALTYIAQEYSTKGQHEQAIQTAQNISAFDFRGSGQILSDMILAAVHAGKLDLAVRSIPTLDKLSNQTMEPINLSRVKDDLWLEVVHSYAQRNQFDAALIMLERIDKDETKVEALSMLVRNLAKTGDEKQASELMDRAVAIARSISP
jgi:tetratricopeptide (TPR) repeat protein